MVKPEIAIRLQPPYNIIYIITHTLEIALLSQLLDSVQESLINNFRFRRPFIQPLESVHLRPTDDAIIEYFACQFPQILLDSIPRHLGKYIWGLMKTREWQGYTPGFTPDDL
jgi:hypothetical protein